MVLPLVLHIVENLWLIKLFISVFIDQFIAESYTENYDNRPTVISYSFIHLLLHQLVVVEA